MSTEEKLRELILKRYYSVREFTIAFDIPYTTMHSIFKRGIGNSSVTNVIKICKALGISADALADGEIVAVDTQKHKPITDRVEVKEILSDTTEILTHSGFLTLEGKPIEREDVDAIIDAMEIGIEMVKRRQS